MDDSVSTQCSRVYSRVRQRTETEKSKISKMNIYVFWTNMKSGTMNNICLNGWISSAAALTE
jgi:hypothetical protein